MIVLHHSPASSHSASVRIVLGEKGLDFTSHEVDLAAFGQHTAEFLAVNPAGMVPVLEDGGHRLTEAFLIMLYLEERYPHPPLGGENPQTRYAVQKWGKHVETHIAAHLAVVRWAASRRALDRDFTTLPAERAALWRKAASGFHEEEVSASREALRRAAVRLALDLEAGPWLAGSRFTLADAAVFPHARQFSTLGISVSPQVEAWLARVEARPSVRCLGEMRELVPTMGPERSRWG